MSTQSRLLAVVAAINTVLQFLKAAGLSWGDLNQAIRRAEESGRPFGPEDLEPFRERARAAIARLEAGLAAREAAAPHTSSARSMTPAAGETKGGETPSADPEPPSPPPPEA